MKLSLRAVLIIGTVGLQFVTVGAILLSTMVTTEDALLTHARNLMSELSRETIGRSEQFLEPAQSTADLTLRLSNTKVLGTKNNANLERYFFEQLRLNPWFSGLYFGGTDGSFIFVKRGGKAPPDKTFLTKIVTVADTGRKVELFSRKEDFSLVRRYIDPNDNFDPRTRPWFSKARESKGLAWTNPYIFFTSQRSGVSATGPIIDGSGNFIGAVGVDIEIDQISSFLRGLKIGENGSAFILNRNGDVIAYPDSNKIIQPKTNPKDGLRFVRINELDDPLARAAFASLDQPMGQIKLNEPKFVKFHHNDRAYHAVFTPFLNSNWPWMMGIYVPEDDFLGVIKRNTMFNLYLAIAIAGIACIISFFVWRTIASPMRKLSENADLVRAGNLDIQPSITSIYREISDTGNAFRAMVSGLREQERENVRLRKLQSDLVDSTRKSSLGHFASAVSHEINQPLAAISTYLQVAERLMESPGEKEEKRAQEAILKAREQADRAGMIIKSLREIVEAGEPQRSTEDINDVVGEAIELARGAAITGIAQIRQEFDQNAPPVLISRVQIQQVVLNLIRNGIEAMADAPTRILSVTTSSSAPDTVTVSVTDTGPGLSEEVASRLFESLVTTKPQGMGVGLSISRTIVEAHGGRLQAIEKPEGGMIFRFSIPAVLSWEAEDER